MLIQRKYFVFILIVISLIQCSCKSVQYTFSTFPPNTILRGEMQDGKSLYLLREDSIEMRGIGFVYSTQAVVDRFSYEMDEMGKVVFSGEKSKMSAKLKKNPQAEQLTLRVKNMPEYSIERGVLNLKYHYTKQEKEECRERYREFLFDSIQVQKNLHYGMAPGYYVSRPIDDIANDDYTAIFRTIMDEFLNSIVKKGLREQQLFLDFYSPYGDPSIQRPLFLFVHGGSFMFGDKANPLQRQLTDELVRKGYAVASINYRLGSTLLGFNAIEQAIYRGVQDTRAALRYLVHNARLFGIDTSQIYLGGSSAGAIIALTTTYMDENELFDCAHNKLFKKGLGGLDATGNQLRTPFRISGVASLWGAVVDMAIIDEKQKIPTLLFHGTRDDIVQNTQGLPFKEVMGDRIHNIISSGWKLYGSESIYNHMTKYNLPVKYVQFEGYGHEPQIDADGNTNRNLHTIKEELSGFLYQNVAMSYPDYAIWGSKTVRKEDAPASYRIGGTANEVCTWDIDGGLFLDLPGKEARVAWFSDRGVGKISVCIQDARGIKHKQELYVVIDD